MGEVFEFCFVAGEKKARRMRSDRVGSRFIFILLYPFLLYEDEMWAPAIHSTGAKVTLLDWKNLPFE